MTWTVDDEKEYQRLLREKQLRDQMQAGQNALTKANAAQPRRATSEPEQGFDAFRMIAGGLQDTWNAVAEFGDYLDQKSDEFWVKTTGVDYRNWDISKALTFDTQVGVIGESKNPWERGGRAVTSFLVPYAGWGKAFGVFKSGIGFSSTVARSLAATTATNITAMDAYENNLANVLRDDLGLDNGLLDALATEKDDDLLWGRVKASISNLPLDIIGEGVFEGGVALAKAYRATRQTNEATKALVEATKEDITISREAAKAAAEAAEAAKAAPAPAPAPAPAVAGSGKTVEVADGEVVVKASQVKARSITTLDEFVATVKDAATTMDPVEFTKLADALVENPHEALAALKIDPAKLDYSLFSDPQAIIAMQHSLADMVATVAEQTGRTGKVVSWKETLKGARVLATMPNILKQLVGDTKGLATRMTAARIMVGSHAHKLLEAAEAATKELQAGGKGKAYAEFLTTLEAHGHLLGVLRGAGSEVGRALQSLQMSVEVSDQIKSLAVAAEEAAKRAEALKAQRIANLAKGRAAKAAAGPKVDVGSDEVISFLKEVAEGRIDLTKLEAIAKAAGVNVERAAKEMGLKYSELKRAKKADEAYESLFKDLTTDAGRLRLLNQLRNAKGDLTKLSRLVKRREQTGLLSKADFALKDTTGALFSIGTTALNVTGALTIMTLKGVTHGLAAAGLSGASLATGSREASLGARKQALKAWATFHAPTQAFGDGFARAWAELKTAGLDEAAYIADGLKLEKWAAKTQMRADEMARGTDRSFLKEDFQTSRGLAVSPDTLNRIAADIEKYPIGKLGQMGLEWFLRLGGAAVNTAGAGFRMGTTMFVNAPDQFSGALATRIGQHTAAIDIAAGEAAEAGLDGAALLQYIKARSMEIGELIDDGMVGADPFADGFQDTLMKAGVEFAQEVNFSDNLEYGITRWASGLGNVRIIGTLTLPFPKTPLRVMERSVMDYTPLYGIKQATREAWASGNAEVRGEIAARFTLTLGMMSAAWAMAGSDTIVGIDGGWRNTARRERNSYTIKIGDSVWEYNRLDPLGTVLGLVADYREYMEETQENRDIVTLVDGEFAGLEVATGDFVEAIFWSVFKNVLSKSYLDSLEQINAMSAARSEEEFASLAGAWAASLGTRAVPLSGVQRQYEKMADEDIKMARGLFEGMVKASFGADRLPQKLDPIFGRPMKYTAGERLVGFKGGPVEIDPVNKELARLSFDVQPPRWTQRGVKLTTSQMERFLQLRGHTIKVDGFTLEEAVTTLMDDPRYSQLTDTSKVEAIKQVMRPYTKEATDQLIQEDDDFAFKLLVQETKEDFQRSGRDMRELKPEAVRLAKELGISPPE